MMSSSSWSTPTYTQLLTTILLLLIVLLLTLANLTLPRLYRLLTSPPPPAIALNASSQRTPKPRGHLLIVLGSGGHTAEMFSILRNLGHEYLDTRFARRTWVVSSGDGFSVGRAVEFEKEMEMERVGSMRKKGDSGMGRINGSVGRSDESSARKSADRKKKGIQENHVTYTITTVRRARKVHQPLLTTPFSSLGCLWDCICVLRGSEPTSTSNDNSQVTTNTLSHPNIHSYPDLILTNGPGTGVIMVLASLILLFLGVPPITSSTSSISSTQATLTYVKNLFGDDTKANGDNHNDSNNGRGGAMRTIYIESWARVKSLSLSARILRFMASRVLVQWREVGGKDGIVDLTKEGREGLQGGDVRDGDGEEDRTVQMEKERERERTKNRIQWPRNLEYVGAVVT